MKLVSHYIDITALPEFKAMAPRWTSWINETIGSQLRDNSEDHGAFRDPTAAGWNHGRHTGFALSNLIAAMRWADALQIDKAELRETVRLAINFLAKRQHPNGQLDLGGFYSPNVAGFVTTPLARGYKRLQQDMPEADELLTPLEGFLKRAAEAIIAGSAYTANHRWTAACAPLAEVYSLWPEQRYIDKIEDYLADGIDCNSEGCWYEERSRNYDGVSNDGLLTLVDTLGRTDLVEHIIRNAYFSLELIQPNGEMDTSFSHRQDRHQANKFGMSFWLARRLAQLTGDGVFTTIAESLLKSTYSPAEGGAQPIFYQFEEHPEAMPEAVPLESKVELHKVYPQTGIFRKRNKDSALTLSVDKGGHYYDSICDSMGGVKKSEDWFHLHYKDIVVQSVHLSAAGSGHAQPTTMEVMSDTILMKGEKTGWTFPLHFRKDSPDYEMPQHTDSQIAVKLADDGIDMNLQTVSKQALAGVLAFYVRPGISLQEGDVEQELAAGKRYKLKGGDPLTLRSKNGAHVQLQGLPQAAHHFPVFPALSIPSPIRETCACLYLGYRLPFETQLKWQFASSEK